MNVLVTGGCGFVGSVLISHLLKKNYKVTVIDTQWFGNYLKKNKNLRVIKSDIRKLEKISFKKFDSIIHLANIANDPAVELDPSLSWEINVLASYKLINKAVDDGVNQFIYASSGSVYGIKKEKKVVEDMKLLPISVYNKTKMIAERVFLSYKDKIKVHCIRPATVCGYSPRMRLDVSVNLLTFQALLNKEITIFGGSQIRPNINIKDLVRVFEYFLKNNSKLKSGAYNAGFENISIKKLANKISKKIKSKVKTTKSNDPRSYRQNSDKLIKTGFRPLYGIDEAIEELKKFYEIGLIKKSEKWHTVKWMKKLMKKKTI